MMINDHAAGGVVSLSNVSSTRSNKQQQPPRTTRRTEEPIRIQIFYSLLAAFSSSSSTNTNSYSM